MLQTVPNRPMKGPAEPTVAVFAYDPREHIVRQFDSLRAVVIVEAHQAPVDQPSEFVLGQTRRHGIVAGEASGNGCAGGAAHARHQANLVCHERLPVKTLPKSVAGISRRVVRARVMSWVPSFGARGANLFGTSRPTMRRVREFHS